MHQGDLEGPGLGRGPGKKWLQLCAGSRPWLRGQHEHRAASSLVSPGGEAKAESRRCEGTLKNRGAASVFVRKDELGMERELAGGRVWDDAQR